MWVQAPFLLLRFPALLLAVTGALAVLVVAVASGPLFLSSAQNAALEKQLASVSRWNGGLTVVATGRVAGRIPYDSPYGVQTAEDLFERRATLLDQATAQLSGLTPAVLTIIGSGGQASRAGPVPRFEAARLLYRDGALSRIDRVAGVPGNGVWISDRIAKKLRLGPGGSFVLTLSSGSVSVPVTGVFRDLARRPLPEFWSSLSTYIEPYAAGSELVLPPALVLADRDTFSKLERRLQDDGSFEWQFPLRTRRMTIEDAGVLADGLQRLVVNIKGSVPPFSGYFSYPTVFTLLPDAVEQAQATAFALRGPVGTLSLAGVIVALALVGATGIFWLHRRRVEFRQLAARALPASLVGVRTLLEAAPAAAVVALGAWFGTRALIGVVGPSTLVSAQAIDTASNHVAWTVGGAVALIGLVVAAGIPRQVRSQGGRVREVVGKVPWEAVLVALAGAAFYEISTRGSVVVSNVAGPPKIDRLLLLFPLLFIGGASALAVRLARIGLLRVRGVGRRWPVAWFLAFRRVASASATALLLVAAAALSVGIVTFAGALSNSVRASADRKAEAFTGSDVSLEIGGADPALPAGFPFPATLVTRYTAGPTLIPQRTTVEIIGVDRATFARAAFWDRSFADQPLSDLLRRLDASDPFPLPALILSPQGVEPSTLLIGTSYLPVDLVGRLHGFPGATPVTAILVTDRRVLFDSLRSHNISPELLSSHVELWARGEPQAVVKAARKAGLDVLRVTKAEEVRSSPRLLAITWTSGFMVMVGALTGIVALVGMLLYLQARQRQREVSYALAKRMGLGAAAHGTSLLVETAGLLAASFVLGTLFGAVAGAVTFGRLDPIPSLQPPMRLRLAPGAMAAVAAILLAASMVGALLAQGRARRAKVAEVMRLAP
jgi:putative ABC transport system permease protein